MGFESGPQFFRARRADDGRLRQPARPQPRRQPLVQMEHPGDHHHRDQPRHGHHQGHQDLLDRLPPQRAEELRPALEAHGIDEQREQHRLDARINGHPHLADQHRRQQRPRHAPQLERPEPELAHPVTERQGRKQRDFRSLMKDASEKVHSHLCFWVEVHGGARQRKLLPREGRGHCVRVDWETASRYWK